MPRLSNLSNFNPNGLVDALKDKPATADALLLEEILRRYPLTTAEKIAGLAQNKMPSDLRAEMLASDFGLDKYKVHFRPRQAPSQLDVTFPSGETTRMDELGHFDPYGQALVVRNTQGDNPDDGTLPTIAHELGHTAGYIKRGEESQSINVDPASHHKFFQYFEPQMAQSMAAQFDIEHGLPVSKEVRRAYPWLADVKPSSSNKLATPYTDATSEDFIPPALWNDLFDAKK